MRDKTRFRSFGKASFVLSILLFFLALPHHAAHAHPVIKLTNGEWPPYFSESLKEGGVGTRVCTAAFSGEGIEVKYVYLPWKRAMITAGEGIVEGSLAWRRTPERKKKFLFSDPLFSENLVFFHRKSTPFHWTNVDDVGRLRIGGTIGYSYEGMLAGAALKNGGKYETARSDIANFKKLIAGRIDVFPCSEVVGRYLLQTEFSPKERAAVSFHPTPFETGALYLLFPKKNTQSEQLRQSFNRGLKKLQESGEYDRIMQELGQ